MLPTLELSVLIVNEQMAPITQSEKMLLLVRAICWEEINHHFSKWFLLTPSGKIQLLVAKLRARCSDA